MSVAAEQTVDRIVQQLEQAGAVVTDVSHDGLDADGVSRLIIECVTTLGGDNMACETTGCPPRVDPLDPTNADIARATREQRYRALERLEQLDDRVKQLWLVIFDTAHQIDLLFLQRAELLSEVNEDVPISDPPRVPRQVRDILKAIDKTA